MELADKLNLQWVHRSAHSPMGAWPEPLREFHRQPFDYAYQMVSASGLLLYGSSADCKLYALDAGSSKVKWTFFTGGPVRFSPVISDSKVYAGSDDGFVYCLELDEGKLLWKRRIGPRDDLVVGNERMISRWPLRSGVLVKDGIVYVTAGMWNVDGVYIVALDAETGRIIWQNDSANYIYLVATHGEEGIVNVPPQGYLLENEGTLIVPTGRGQPAGFDLATGKLLWYQVEWGKPHHAGGSWAFVNDGIVLTMDRKCNAGVAPIPYDNTEDEYFHNWPQGLMGWDTQTGDERMAVAGLRRAVAADGIIYCANVGTLVAADFAKLKRHCWDLRGVIVSKAEKLGANAGWMKKFGIEAAQSKLNAIYTTGRTGWETKCPAPVYDMIVAGDKVYLGCEDKIVAYNKHSGKKVFDANVNGRVRGIIAAGGRLYASTDVGKIYCFGATEAAVCLASTEKVEPDDSKIARDILSATGIDAGYALLYGSDASTAVGLAKNSRLFVSCIEDNKSRMLESYKALDRVGVYGTRVLISHGEFADLPYCDYFANLVVATDRLSEQQLKELYRVLRPYGGKAYLACSRVSRGQWKDLLAKAGIPAHEVKSHGGAVLVERGALAGAGSWTHQCGDTRNSYNSADSIVRAPFKLQWWGGPGPARAVNRHQYGPNPVAVNGRFFMTGRHHVTCCDVYNGFEYWAFHYPNIGRIGAKYWGGGAITDGDNVYVASGDSCLVIDAADGRLKNVFRSPILKEQYSLRSAQSFLIDGDAQTSGTVKVKKNSEGLVVELVRKDKQLLDNDGWDLFFDFRPREKRDVLYTEGAFHLRVTEQQNKQAQIRTMSPTKACNYTISGSNNSHGVRTSISFSWDDLRKLVGTDVSEFGFGFALICAPCIAEDPRVTPEQVEDPRKYPCQKRFILAQSYNERLTCGLGEFTLGEGGKIGYPGSYDSQGGESFTWNYLAVSDGLLYGSASRETNFVWHGRPASNPEDEVIFAMDKKSGKLKWLTEAQINFNPLFIGIDKSKIYFVDKDNFGPVAAKNRRGLEKNPVTLKAADKFTGEILWTKTDKALEDKDRLQVAESIVLLVGSETGASAFSTEDGTALWSTGKSKNSKPPVLMKDRFFWKPNEFGMSTGEKEVAVNPITGREMTWQFHTEGRGGCGEMSGCDNAVFFRDGYLAYHDLVNNDGEHWVGGIRPSCASNILPVGGLVVQPEGSSGCTCSSFSFQTCIALAPAQARDEIWTMLKSTVSGVTDIQDLKLNLGAPGDRKVAGDWYLSLPRNVRPSYQLIPVTAGNENISYIRRSADHVNIDGAEMDWLYASQAHDIRKIRVDLVFNRPIVAEKADTPLAIDGRAEVLFEDNPNVVQLCDENRTVYNDAAVLFSYDQDNLYVTLKREPAEKDGRRVPWTMETEGDEALTWKDDSWTIIIDSGGTTAYSVSASGGRRREVIKEPENRGEPESDWKTAVWISPENGTWTTEIAIPWQELGRDVGSNRDANISVQIKGYNRTGIGPGTFEYKYRGMLKHKMNAGATALTLKPFEPRPDKRYRLVLHFAELEQVSPGDRVFDVLVNDRMVIEGLDIVEEANGTHKALRKEISNISASEYLDVEFVPHEESLPPVLSGLELAKKE